MPICDRLLLSPLISEASPSAATTTSASAAAAKRLVEQLLVGAAVARNIAPEHRGIALLLLVADHVAALGIDDLHPFTGHLPQPFDERQRLRKVGSDAPRAGHVRARSGQRADHGDRSLAPERQHVAFVFQQYEALARDTARLGAVCGRIDLRGGALRIAVTVGIVEKSQLEFRFEHQAARAVDIGQRDTPLFERLLQGSQITLAHHVHVDTRLDGARRHLFQIAQTVRDHLVDARVVRDDEALEAPLLAQTVVISQRLAVAGIPSTSLNDAMTLPTPASTAAL